VALDKQAGQDAEAVMVSTFYFYQIRRKWHPWIKSTIASSGKDPILPKEWKLDNLIATSQSAEVMTRITDPQWVKK